jgi:hypothetical protein
MRLETAYGGPGNPHLFTNFDAAIKGPTAISP